jgi:hypothetical protein
MTDKKDAMPGDEIPGHLDKEMHHGVEEITDMGDYALSPAERIALGIDSFPDFDEEPAKPTGK